LQSSPNQKPRSNQFRVIIAMNLGHKPPQYEDTVWGKYAGVLFSIAS